MFSSNARSSRERCSSFKTVRGRFFSVGAASSPSCSSSLCTVESSSATFLGRPLGLFIFSGWTGSSTAACGCCVPRGLSIGFNRLLLCGRHRGQQARVLRQTGQMVCPTSHTYNVKERNYYIHDCFIPSFSGNTRRCDKASNLPVALRQAGSSCSCCTGGS